MFYCLKQIILLISAINWAEYSQLSVFSLITSVIVPLSCVPWVAKHERKTRDAETSLGQGGNKKLSAMELTFKSVTSFSSALILQRNEDKVIPNIAAINRSENNMKLRL